MSDDLDALLLISWSPPIASTASVARSADHFKVGGPADWLIDVPALPPRAQAHPLVAKAARLPWFGRPGGRIERPHFR